MIVLDASAFIDVVDGNREVADRLADAEVHAPHLLDVEVASGLRRLVAAGRIDHFRAKRGLTVLAQADIHRHPHTPLLELVWSLRDRVAPYDAVYVALATVLEVPLVTTDARLAGAHGLACTVELC